MKVHFIEGAPKAVGPYSHAVEHGNTLYVSGQLGLDPVTNALREGVIHQAEQALENLKAILENNGLTMSNVVKTLVLLDNIDDFKAVNEIYGQYFEQPYPARSAFEVGKLPLGALVEIEAIAYIK